MVEQRFLREKIASTRDIPKKIRSLVSFPIEAVIRRKVDSGELWLVEVKVVDFQKILESHKRLKEVETLLERRRDKIERYKLDLDSRAESINNLRDELRRLQDANEQLMKNIENPSRHGPPVRSPKNYLAVAMERGTKFGSPALRGGDGGLEKK